MTKAASPATTVLPTRGEGAVSDFEDEDFADEEFDDEDLDDEDLDDEDFEDEDLDDEGFADDEVGGEGNRIVGAHARAVVEHVAEAIVEEPEELEIDLEERDGEVTVLIHASSSDLGRLIGKRGRVIQALRQVVRAAGAGEDVRATVDVVE